MSLSLFPKHFFKHYLLVYILPVVVINSFLLIVFYFFFQSKIIALLIFILFLGFSLVLTTYLLSRHLGHLLHRTYLIGSKFNQTLPDYQEDFIYSDYDLFYEFDRALLKLGEKLKRGKRRLAHELEQGKTLMRYLHDPVVAIDIQGSCLFFNSAFATQFLDQKFLNIFSEKGLSISEVFRDPQFSSNLRNVIAEKKMIQFQLALPVRTNKIKNEFSIHISPLFEEKDQKTVYGAMILFHDITQYRQTEKLRLEFIENASHELRTPLTSVRGYLDLAISDLKNNQVLQAQKMLEVAQSGVERLVLLVNDLLDLSEVDHPSGLNISIFNPLELTEKVFHVLSPLASEKKMQLVLTSEVPMVRLDEARFEQVLINLVTNAIKYNPQYTIVKVTWNYNNQNQLKLKVEDNGVGIDPKHWDRLFDRFYRVEKSRDRSQGGTGLGLAIVKQIVESHKGSVHIEFPSQNETSKSGTCFVITLPES